jgi:hypothetical protein
MGMGIINKQAALSPGQLSLANNQCHIRKEGYLSIINTFQQIWDFGSRRTHVWWDPDESIKISNCPETQIKLGTIGVSVTRTGLQRMKDSEPSLPINKIPAAYYKQLLQQNAAIAVMTNNPATANQMLAKLRTYGNWSLVRQETIAQGEIRFSVYVYTLDGKIR